MEKIYKIQDSPLYKLRSRKKLLQQLNNISYCRILEISNNTNTFYRCFQITNEKGKARDVAECLGELGFIQKRLQAMLRRVEMPYYLFSKRLSSAKANAEFHKNNPYVFTIDLKDFFPHCTLDRLASSLCFHFHQAGDISHLIASLLTLNGVVPQGSTTSSIAAFIANKSMFDEILELCKEQGVLFSVFVDDLTISSNERIDTSVRDKIIGIIRKNEMPINYKKIKYFKKSHHKHITGSAVFDGQVKVENKKLKKFFKMMIPNESNLKKITGMYRYLKSYDQSFKIVKYE